MNFAASRPTAAPPPALIHWKFPTSSLRVRVLALDPGRFERRPDRCPRMAAPNNPFRHTFRDAVRERFPSKDFMLRPHVLWQPRATRTGPPEIERSFDGFPPSRWRVTGSDLLKRETARVQGASAGHISISAQNPILFTQRARPPESRVPPVSLILSDSFP